MTAAPVANRHADPPPLTRCGRRGQRYSIRLAPRVGVLREAARWHRGTVARGQESTRPCWADHRSNLALILVACKRLNRRSSNNNQRKDDHPRFDTVTWCGKPKRDKGRAMSVT
jgi:hypothetical protein